MNDERYYHEIVTEREGPFVSGNAVLPTQENVARQIDLAKDLLDLPFNGLVRVAHHRDFTGLACYDPIQKELLFRNRIIHEGYILHEAVHAVMDDNKLLLRVSKVEDNPFFIFGRLFNDTVADLASLEAYGAKFGNYNFHYGDFKNSADTVKKLQKYSFESKEVDPQVLIDGVVQVVEDMYNFSLDDLIRYEGQLAFEGAMDLYRKGFRNRNYVFGEFSDLQRNRMNKAHSFPFVYLSLFDRQDA